MRMKKLSKKVLIALAMSGLLVVGGTALTQSNSVSANSRQTSYMSRSNYYQSKPYMIYTKAQTNLYKNPQRTKLNYKASAGNYYRIINNNRRYHALETNTHNWMTANKNFVKATKGYQNPRGYYQVGYRQIKGNQMPSFGVGYEGMRVYKFKHALGLADYHNLFNNYDASVVRNYQARHHLRATGRVNYSTWRKMGFSKYQWNHLDNAIPKDNFSRTANRNTRINAGIRRIKKYMGGTWITGTSSSPEYKKADCSGLAIQYLLGGGLKSKWTPLRHSEPGNEYDSTKMWSDPKLKRVPFNNRQRGDLIFFAPSYSSSVWHIGVMTSRNTMIDSWPPYVQYHSIFNSEHGVIVGVKRPFM